MGKTKMIYLHQHCMCRLNNSVIITKLLEYVFTARYRFSVNNIININLPFIILMYTCNHNDIEFKHEF